MFVAIDDQWVDTNSFLPEREVSLPTKTIVSFGFRGKTALFKLVMDHVSDNTFSCSTLIHIQFLLTTFQCLAVVVLPVTFDFSE